MAYDRVTARSAIVAAARSMIGRYAYQAGGGHLWTPGQPVPRSFDCSGFTFYEFLSTLNIDLRVDGETTSEIQWGFALGGEVHGVNLVLPGMLVYFIDYSYPDPGHVGIVSQVNKSGVNTYVSAYDTALGIVEEPWTWGAGTFYGVTDPISTLPLPKLFEEDPMWLDIDPGNKYAILVCPAQGGWYGLTAEKRNYYAANGVPSAKSPITPQVFAELTKLGMNAVASIGASMNAEDIAAVATVGTAIAGAAAYVGRVSVGVNRKRREDQEKSDRDSAELLNTVLELTWAINGRPATQWERQRPGLRDNVQSLSDEFAAHSKEDMARFKEVAEQNKLVAEQLADVAELFKRQLRDNP